jgi:DNA-binding transcriptional ArsR family regulator
MDSAVSTAARALSVGDPLQALKFVALRADPPALALRGIAMAQLGELAPARSLLGRAAAAFGSAEPLAQARCVVAQAEVALALRDLHGAGRGLSDAISLLARRGDLANAMLGRLVLVRRLVLLGQVEQAERALDKLTLAQAPPQLVALASLVAADIAMKGVRAAAAERALELALRAARKTRIPALANEVERARQRFEAPVARLVRAGTEQQVGLAELELLVASGELLVDACRREVRVGKSVVSLVTRPILLDLLAALAERAQSEVPRDALIARVFGARRANDSHRVRLRVEIGRLRKLLARMADVCATPLGFALQPRGARSVALLLPPGDGEASELWALLRGGEAWATSALSAALGKSQRSVQRALAELEGEGKVRATGDGRARRWVAAPGAGFATTLLLVAPGTLG